MSSPIIRLSLALRPTLSRITVTRNCGWTRDWKPGPVPKTEEERVAAAKKYNLIPEDYEINDDTEGYGDYPKLPPVGMDARDPYEDMDYHYHRRNYGETLHVDYDLHMSDRNNPNEKWYYTGWQMWSHIILFFGSLAGAVYLGEYFDIRICTPYKPKQWPGPGKVHYTFEPVMD